MKDTLFSSHSDSVQPRNSIPDYSIIAELTYDRDTLLHSRRPFFRVARQPSTNNLICTTLNLIVPHMHNLRRLWRFTGARQTTFFSESHTTSFYDNNTKADAFELLALFRAPKQSIHTRHGRFIKLRQARSNASSANCFRQCVPTCIGLVR